MNREASHRSSMSPHLARRGFLTGAAGAAGAVAMAPLLAACGHSGGGGTGTSSTSELAKILPAYVPNSAVKPDIPSVDGSDPGFLTYPADLVRTVGQKPGSGSTYSTITPLWASIPPVSNQYYQAVDAALGANLQINPSNGNLYGNFLPTLFAGDKLPDWLDIPSWNEVNITNFGTLVQAKFADLTPYLAGDNIKRYGNLAALPTGAWQAGVWNNKIYGIPVYPGTHVFAGAIFYRADILTELGLGTPAINSVQDLYSLGKEINDPKRGRWAFDDILSYLIQPFGVPFNPPNWSTDDKGDLIAAWETPQIIEMLNWAASVVRAGMMHPESIAFQTSSGTQRFYNGSMVITGGGIGGWNGYDAVAGRAANKNYVRMALPPFTASGTGTPAIAIGNSAGIFSYLNASLSKSQVAECLRIANYIAAPFGSYEYTLSNFGVQGVDWTPSANGPVLTAIGQKDVQTTFNFLASAVNVQSVQSGYVDVVKAVCSWQQNAGKYAYKPLFWNMNVSVPPKLANALTATTFTASGGNLLAEVVRGKSSIADFQAAVKNWQKNGGNALRAFFDGIRAKYGDA